MFTCKDCQIKVETYREWDEHKKKTGHYAQTPERESLSEVNSAPPMRKKNEEKK